MTAIDPFADMVVGYPKLAAKFEVFPEIAIYRRFGALNALNLLYYQAELSYVEKQLQEQQQKDDFDRTGPGAGYARNWQWLKYSRADGGDGHQLELVMYMRELLQQYSELDVHRSAVPWD